MTVLDEIMELKELLERHKAFAGHKGRPGQRGGSLPQTAGLASGKQPIVSTSGQTISRNSIPTLSGKPLDISKIQPGKLITKATSVVGPNGKPMKVNSYGEGNLQTAQSIVDQLNGSKTGGITFSVVQSVDDTQMYHIINDEELNMEEALRGGSAREYLKAKRRRDEAKRRGPKTIRHVVSKYSKR